MHPVHLDILRALFRLHRYRRSAELAAIELRVPLSGAPLRASLRALEQAGLVMKDGHGLPRLTMMGLTVAAGAPRAKRTKASRRLAA